MDTDIIFSSLALLSGDGTFCLLTDVCMQSMGGKELWSLVNLYEVILGFFWISYCFVIYENLASFKVFSLWLKGGWLGWEKYAFVFKMLSIIHQFSLAVPHCSRRGYPALNSLSFVFQKTERTIREHPSDLVGRVSKLLSFIMIKLWCSLQLNLTTVIGSCSYQLMGMVFFFIVASRGENIIGTLRFHFSWTFDFWFLLLWILAVEVTLAVICSVVMSILLTSRFQIFCAMLIFYRINWVILIKNYIRCIMEVREQKWTKGNWAIKIYNS